MEKKFPVTGTTKTCKPQGTCCVCGQAFDKVEGVGWVKPKGGQRRYFHTRCVKKLKIV